MQTRHLCPRRRGSHTSKSPTTCARSLTDTRAARPPRAARYTALEMDLHVVAPLASPAERAAVDAVLDPEIGPPVSMWRGGLRAGAAGDEAGGHAPHGAVGRTARREPRRPAPRARRTA